MPIIRWGRINIMDNDKTGGKKPAPLKSNIRHGGARQLMRDFLPYLTGDTDTKRRIAATVGFTLMQKTAAVCIPLVYGAVVNIVSGDKFTFYILIAVLVGYALVRLSEQVFDELKYCVFARVAQRAVRTLAVRVFDHLHGLSQRFHLNRQTGGLSRVIERGTKSIEFMLTFMLFSTVPTLLEIFMVSGVLWAKFDFRYTAALLITMIGYVVYTLVVTEWRLHFRRRMNACDKNANTLVIDSLLNHETVKHFNARKMETSRYDNLMRDYENAAVKNRTSLSVLNIGQGVIIAAGLLVMMLMAGDDVAAGRISVGDFVVVNTFLLQLYLPLDFLGTVYREIRQALTDMEEMFILLDEPLEVKDVPDALPLKISGGGIVFNNVRFAYDDERGDILRGVSFGVRRGQKTAVVGPSGSGKSTIGRLLSRFYDPGEGAVLIDGQDIRKCKQESVRAAIGVVPQDAVLFNDTILHNIRYGKEGATDEQVHRAAKLAAID
ncbi:MAG: ABCB family ABC transporter ATP-binding protein/permease, partial [Gammaproteobacteria bacterium]